MKKIIVMLLLITGFAGYAKAQDTAKVKRTPEERAARMGKMMEKRLSLAADQSKQINAILADRATKEDALKGQKGSKDERMKVMADADAKIDAILTPDQRKQYAALKETAKERGMGKKGEPISPATTPPPAQ
jgi:Spy/CpxP family protein refolding chaperone